MYICLMLLGAKGLTGDENIFKRSSKMQMQPVTSGQPENVDAMPLANRNYRSGANLTNIFAQKKLHFKVVSPLITAAIKYCKPKNHLLLLFTAHPAALFTFY